MTVMSYFSQSENTYINDTEAYTLTPMIADILAIAQMYGTVNTLRTGNTIYGEGTNAGSTYAIFTTENRDADETVTVSMTVVDSGGTDTFDFHSDTAAQRIDLRAGTTSDVYGDLGTVQIALGTVIENAFAGNGSDVVTGNDAANRILGNGGNDSLVGNGGNDTLLGGDGRDSLNGGDGNDSLVGGTTTTDLRDVIFGDAGNDSIDGGYGNDELKGGIGNDLILGGFGVDTLVGNEGNDVLQGEAGADLILGSDGDDIINGGFANDRIQGGAGADRFQHTGVIGHGSDWIQDYSAAQNDMLVFVGAGASISDFGVNRAITTGAGAAGVAEAFVVYRPNGQILWALIDGGDDATINLLLNGAIYDLVA
jgi:serralysin